MYKKFTFSFLILIAYLFVACTSGTLEVGVEPSATTTPIPATITQTDALQPTHTPVPLDSMDIPMTSTATPIPVPTDAPTPPPASPYAGILYRLGDQLYRIGADGQSVALTSNIDPQMLPGQFTPRAVVSADGQYMVSWWDWSDLWLIELTSGETRNLTNTPNQEECCAQFWQSDPNTIVFLTREATGDTLSYQMAAINLDGTNYRLLEDVSLLGLPALAPDGTSLAYNAEGKPWLFSEAGGSQLFNPANYGMNAIQEFGLTNPAWSNTGRYVAWMLSGDPFGSNSPQGGAVVFDIVGNSYNWLHPHEPMGSEAGFLPAVWSPDDNWVVVFDHSISQPSVWVMHPDGSNETMVYAPNGVRSILGLQALWSPDAQRLLVIDPNGEGGTELTLFNVQTNATETLPLPVNAVLIAWK